jgi:hypothetical protein
MVDLTGLGLVSKQNRASKKGERRATKNGGGIAQVKEGKRRQWRGGWKHSADN